MKRLISLLLALVSLSGTATASGLPQPGDFFLISRDRYGIFIGSHKLFLKSAPDLRKVTYCNREYYVRIHSVAWTQVEVNRGHTVQLEFNFGRGWRPICGAPEQQVTLTDLGINRSPSDLLTSLYAEEEEAMRRLSAMGSRFQAFSKSRHHIR